MENDFRQSDAAYPQPEQPTSKKKPGKLLFLVLAAVAFLIVAAVIMMGGSKDDNKSAKHSVDDPKAHTMLFDALGKAASQQTIRVAQLRKTYATKADLASDTDPGFIQSSVAELSPQQFRALYAQRPYDKETFSMQRCQDGVAYVDGLGSVSGSKRPAPKSLAEANEYLKQMYRVSEGAQFAVCPHVGVMPGGIVDLAPARLSDGLMPVTLTEQQATNWKDKVQAANIFNVKDEGMVAYAGKQLRKLSFAPKDPTAEVNKILQDIFYETGEIEKIKRDHPDAKWQYEFIPVNTLGAGSIKGYYLIDEATGLPVYSEIQGISEDKEKDKDRPVTRANIGFNKQTYAFPTALSIELTSPLEILE